MPDSRVRIPTKSNCRLGSVAAKAKQLQLDLFKLPKQPINKAVELAAQHSALDGRGAAAGAGLGAVPPVSQPETLRCRRCCGALLRGWLGTWGHRLSG